MIDIIIGPNVRSMHDLFFAISDSLKIGVSGYSGWDAFYDTLFAYAQDASEDVRFLCYDEMSEEDRGSFSDVVLGINEDIGHNRLIIVRGP